MISYILFSKIHMRALERDQPIIVLTNPVPTEGGKFNGKVTDDVYTKSGTPSSSLGAIDGVLKGAGFTKVFTEDSRFYPKYGNSTPSDIKKIFQSDIIGISGTNRNADSSLDLARQYKECNPKGVVIAGGFGPSMETEKWLRGSIDIVVRREGDVTTPLVVKAITNGDSLENVRGISYIHNGEIINNEDRPLLTEKELSEVPLPFYPDYIKKKRSVHTVNESRGCYGKCKFCCVTVAYNGTYRMKTPERVVEEIGDSRNGEAVFFTGDNLAPRIRRDDSRRLAETLTEKGLIRPYLAQVDASFTEDIDLVRAWKKAGLFYVFKGLESIIPASLKYVHKAFTAKQSINSTNIFRKERIGVHDMVVLAIDGETLKTIEILRKYLRKDNKANTGQFFSLLPLVGTEVGRKKRIFDFAQKESNYFDGQHLTTLPPPEFTCVEMQDISLDLYLDLFNNGHLLSTIFNDLKGFFSLSKSDWERTGRLVMLDFTSHVYARKTVATMKKDPYYQDFREKLRQIDIKVAQEINGLKEEEFIDGLPEKTGIPPKGIIFDGTQIL